MNIRDLFTQEDEDQALADGLLTIRQSMGLRVYNYSDKASVSGDSWDNPAVLHSRGIVTDSVGAVIARPWKKFFNYNQPQAGELDFQAPVEVTNKHDGSLGIMFIDSIYPSNIGITTRGSMESDQARHAQKLLNTPNTLWEGYYPGCISMNPGFTPLVEIVYPGNRIVLNYGNLDTLILLGGVEIETGDYVGPLAAASILDWKGQITEVFQYRTLQEALEAPPRENAEGLVVRTGRDKLVKIKQADYVLMHRAIFGMNELTVWNLLMEDTQLEDILEPLPDEVHEWVKKTYSEFMNAVDSLYYYHQVEVEKIRGRLPESYSRKEFASQALDTEGNFTVLFQIEDEQYTQASKTILKTLRPTGGGDRPILENQK